MTPLKNPDVYITPHQHSQVVGRAFAKGSDGNLRAVHDYRKGGTAVVWGILRGAGQIVRDRLESRERLVYLDHGYIRPGHYNGYYRVVANGLQARLGKADHGRLLNLGWRPESRIPPSRAPILVAPPSRFTEEFFNLEPDSWTTNIINRIESDRRIVVTSKLENPGRDFLDKAYALVTLQSNLAVEAVRKGIPAFVCNGNLPEDYYHPAQAFNSNLSNIDAPYYPSDKERIDWAAQLAACQFTLSEFMRGVPWRKFCVS